MKNLIVTFALVALAVGCGGGTPCEQLASDTEEAYINACEFKTCAFCECRRMGLAVNGAGECYDPMVAPTTCTDAENDAAQTCLDSSACLDSNAEAAQAEVDARCP